MDVEFTGEPRIFVRYRYRVPVPVFNPSWIFLQLDLNHLYIIIQYRLTYYVKPRVMVGCSKNIHIGMKNVFTNDKWRLCPADMNWRASASGQASDRASTSGSEGRKAGGPDRADRDSNWRDHEAIEPVSQPRKQPQSRLSMDQAKQGELSTTA
jgi:hypothetical protein